MPLIELKVPGRYEVFETDTYNAKLTGVLVEDKEPDQYHPTKYQQLRWTWDLYIDGRDDRPRYTTWTSLSLHEKSKLPGLLRALGVEPNDSAGLDVDVCIGKFARIIIEEQDAGKDELGNPKTKNVCKGYATVKKTAKFGNSTATIKAAPAPVADDFEDIPF